MECVNQLYAGIPAFNSPVRAPFLRHRRRRSLCRASFAPIANRHTKDLQHSVESLAGEVRGGAPFKSAACDLKPNAQDDIGRQLYVFYGLIVPVTSPVIFLMDPKSHEGSSPIAFSISITRRERKRTMVSGVVVTHSRFVLNYREPQTGRRKLLFFERYKEALDKREAINQRSRQ